MIRSQGSCKSIYLTMQLLILGTLFLSMLYITGSTWHYGSQLNTRLLPTLDAILDVRQAITQSRLELEQSFLYDDAVLLESAWQHLEQVDHYAQSLLKGRKNQQDVSGLIGEERFRQEVEVLRARLLVFRAVTEERLTTGESILAPGHHENFRQAYLDCIVAAERIKNSLLAVATDRLANQKSSQGVLFTAQILTVLLLVMIAFSLQRRHRLEYQALRAANAELEAEILQRRQTSETLHESETRYRGLLEAIPDTIAVLDSEGVFHFYKAEVDTPAYSSALNIGKNIAEIMPPEVVRMTMAGLRQALQTGLVQKAEFQLQLQGEETPRIFQSRMSLLSGGKQVLWLIRDVTMHKEQLVDSTIKKQKLPKSTITAS